MSANANDYSAAIKRLRQAESAVEPIANEIIAAGKAMQNWRKAIVSNLGIGFPPELVLIPGRPTIDARTWPSAETIGKALSEYHQARSAASGIYNSIPPEDRVGLSAPPPV
jgi:hypothetical protein